MARSLNRSLGDSNYDEKMALLGVQEVRHINKTRKYMHDSLLQNTEAIQAMLMGMQRMGSC